METQINNAIRRMASAPAGGHTTTAAMMGYTPSQLQNRLYQIKGQRISIDEAMLMQTLTNRTDFAAAVAAQSGGVFVPLPEIDTAAMHGEDITDCFIAALERLGELSREWRTATADGSISTTESRRLWQKHHRLISKLTAVLVQTDRIYGDFGNGTQNP